MKTDRVKIFFHDEAPAIGCGWRRVNVRIGRKWVYVRDDNNRGRRFTRGQFEALRPQQIDQQGAM